MALHELRHVQLDQGVFAAKQEASQRLGQLGLPHTGGAEENKGADRAAGVFQTGARAANRFGDGLDGLFLPDDVLGAAHLPSAAGAAILPGRSA
jgi:hypothetical protein